ncbi:MAG: carbohydrate ABC transporter permease, partial [Planctomycetota bacterium]
VRAMEAAIYHRGPVEQVLEQHAAEVQRELDRVYRIRTEPKVNWTVPLAAYLALLASAAGFLWWRHRRQSRSRGYFAREYRAGVLFALPWIIGFVVFTGGPILFSFIISFCEYDVLSAGRWVGLRNYEYLLEGDPVFWKSLTNTLFMLIGLPLGMAVSLGLALLLNAKVKGMSAWRTFFYLPAIMPAVAAALLWLWIFQPTHGLLNRLMGMLGFNWLLTHLPDAVDLLLVLGLVGLPVAIVLSMTASVGRRLVSKRPTQPSGFLRVLSFALPGAFLVLFAAWAVAPVRAWLRDWLVVTGIGPAVHGAFGGALTPTVPVLWLQSETTSKPALIVMGLWGAGAGMIIWLAGLKGIPQHLYEAAEIDGAGWWHKFRHVTLPMLTPYIFFNLLMGMIATLQQFQSAYIMTEGGPVDSTLFFGYHLFNNAFRFFRMGQASAMAWVLCLIVMIITVIQLRTARIWVHYEAE